MKRLAKWAMTACALLALSLAAAATAQAEGFTGADLLEWNRKNQRFYFETSITMAGVIASQNSLEQARCIDRWHLGQEEKQHSAILNAIRTYPSYHPQATILAVLQNACGSFGYARQ